MLYHILLLMVFGVCCRIPLSAGNSSDMWSVYLLYTRQKGRKIINYKMENALVDAYWCYPSLVYYLIAKFPESWWRPLGVALNVLCDPFVSVFVYLASLKVYLGAGIAPEQAGLYALLTGMVFTTQPLLLSINARIKATNARAPSLVLSTAYFITLGQWMTGGGVWWVIPLILLFAGMTLMSMFGFQVLVFFSVCLSVIAMDYRPIAAVAVVSVYALCFRRSVLGMTYTHMINRFINYAGNMKGTPAEGRTLFRSTWTFFSNLRKNYAISIAMVRYRAPLIITLTSAPLLVPTLIALGSCWTRGAAPDGVMLYYTQVTVASVAVFVITCFGFMRAFGEAERYFEYASPFFIVLLAFALTELSAVSASLLLSLFVLQGVFLIYLHCGTDWDSLCNLTRFFWMENSDVAAVYEYLESKATPLRVATLPIKLSFLLGDFAFRSRNMDIRLLYQKQNSDPYRVTGFKEFSDMVDDMNTLSGDARTVMRKLDLDYIVEDVRFTKAHPPSELSESLQARKCEFEVGPYRVFSRSEGTDDA